MSELPPCGLYRTVKKIGPIEVGRLVYFHNHGNPGPGVYFPEKWNHNRAVFAQNGQTVPMPLEAGALHALPAEGFYRVAKAFHCCEKKCVEFQPDQLLQLGYNGAGKALVFVPEYVSGGLEVPERGTFVDDDVLVHMVQLKYPERERRDDLSLPRGIVVH
jgi:hypothetical protein